LKLNLPGLMVHLVSSSICAITPLIALFHVPFLVAKVFGFVSSVVLAPHLAPMPIEWSIHLRN